MLKFSKKLIYWYLQNKRELPWRATTNPYHIWLSEIILQQTRVEQGKPYYFDFINRFPEVKDLANAKEDEVLKLWQGLGYYSRARNLHATAKYIVNERNGNFPDNYKELLKLKGVGDYTASAIASISYNEPTAVVDGNVYRVLSRIYGIETPIDSTAGKRQFKKLAQELIDKDDPATFNQAIMEFGAVQCKPKNPYCLHCPFNGNCVALATNKIDALPVKAKKTKTRNRFFNYIVPVTATGETLLKQRDSKGIWRGLYEFPLLETNKGWDGKDLESKSQALLNGDDAAALKIIDWELFNEQPIVHKLSHQTLYVKFWIVQLQNLNGKETIDRKDLDKYPVPRLIDRFLEAYDFNG